MWCRATLIFEENKQQLSSEKMTEEKVGTLEEEALKRKERLQNLKRKQEEGTKNTDEASKLPA